MTRHEIEESLKQFNTMVHDPESFKPNCLCKFTWEYKYGNEKTTLELFETHII